MGCDQGWQIARVDPEAGQAQGTSRATMYLRAYVVCVCVPLLLSALQVVGTEQKTQTLFCPNRTCTREAPRELMGCIMQPIATRHMDG